MEQICVFNYYLISITETMFIIKTDKLCMAKKNATLFLSNIKIDLSSLFAHTTSQINLHFTILRKKIILGR